MKRKTRRRNIRRTITENYVLVVGKLWAGYIGSTRYNLSAYDLENIGKFTRRNVQKWLDTHAGDFQSVQDFYATAGDKILDWKTEAGEMAYSDSLGDPEGFEENPRKRSKGTRGRNPFDLASLASIVGVKPMTVKLQKVAGKIQMRIEKPTKELLHRLGLRKSANPKQKQYAVDDFERYGGLVYGQTPRIFSTRKQAEAFAKRMRKKFGTRPKIRSL